MEYTYNSPDEVRAGIVRIIFYLSIPFFSAILINWGWNVLAPHLNAPDFTFMEIVAMRYGFGSVCSMLRLRWTAKQ